MTGSAADRAGIVQRMLHPRSIAVIGASADFGKINGRPLKALLDKGYAVMRVTSENARPIQPPAPEVPLVVIGHFGGSAPALEDAGGRTQIATHDIGGMTPDAVLDLIEQGRVGDQRGLNQPGVS